MPDDTAPQNAAEVAMRIAAALHEQHCEYAIGGAIALGYWAAPRGTLDVDVTLYVDPDTVEACIDVLNSIGCNFDSSTAKSSLAEHGFCRVAYLGWRVDAFKPLASFYATAKLRRVTIPLGDVQVSIWDAETLCVFKMMFFRRKDLADVEQLLRAQGEAFDAEWVDRQIEEMYGRRDPRVSSWREIVAEVGQ